MKMDATQAKFRAEEYLRMAHDKIPDHVTAGISIILEKIKTAADSGFFETTIGYSKFMPGVPYQVQSIVNDTITNTIRVNYNYKVFIKRHDSEVLTINWE
jgi:hypothetical protein